MIQGRLYIEEYQPDRKYVPDANDIYIDKVYDPKRQQEFFLIKEPEWFHMEKDKVYLHRITEKWLPYCDEDFSTLFLKIWERFDEDTVLIGYWDIETDDWVIEDDPVLQGLPEEGEKCMPVEEYISLYKK